MMFQYFFSQMCPVYMHIDFCGGDVLMPQHHLYGTQVGSSFQQMCGKTMSESVWANFFSYACLLGIVFNVYEQTYTAQVASSFE